MDNTTDIFLDKIDKVYSDRIPEKVLLRAKQLLLDYICVTLAGAKYNEQKINQYLSFAEPEDGKYTAIGLKRKMALKEAVFLNGLNAHALDYDDGTNAGIIHLGSPIFSVLLNLSQKQKIDIEKLLRAAIVGYETSFTMAYSMQPTHKYKGYHATGTCGVLGAAIAICYALDFSEEERKNAFATACVSATGMLKVLDDQSELKPYNVAKTALLALTSAEMAKAGFKGNADPLAGERGYLAMMVGKPDTVIVDPMLNGTFAVEKTYTKPYAACRYCHPAIECAIILGNSLKEKRVDIQDISEIIVDTYSLAVKGHEHTVIPNVSSAKMSIPYGVAVGLCLGGAGLSEYSEQQIQNKIICELLKKIIVREDANISADFPQRQSAIVTIKTDRQEYKQKIDFPKGEPQNPFTDDEFKKRFCDMCTYAGMSRSEMLRIYDTVLNGTSDVGEIMDLI